MDNPPSAWRNLPLALALVSAAPAATAQAVPDPQRWKAQAVPDVQRWKAQAARVTITRDDWGIAHIHGKTDADAVFGAVYAQAEDDFARIEANYLTATGRTAEYAGKDAIWQDLRQRLYVDDGALKRQYAGAPLWLKRLMLGWADGLNYFLATHPGVRPKVITHFEPWMALSFTEGSIGGDIERISLAELAQFYGHAAVAQTAEETGARPQEPRGSNGIAIAPSKTRDGHALLLINPHTSFYFRSELQMMSDEGLNAYGASTWGQFFIYQGFNAHAGWMHTSSGVDNVDEFAETIETQAGTRLYRYGKEKRPIASRTIRLKYRSASGAMVPASFTVFATHHGPIVAERHGKWIAQALMWRPVPALQQSWLRTKAGGLADYLKVAALQANSSNATLFADAGGNIAYLHPQFVPVRSAKFDYSRAVDGANPATDWKGLHSLASLPSVIAPKIGWVMNTNNWPYSAAGPQSPKAANFPAYMDSAGENARGEHATLLLTPAKDVTPEKLMAMAYDSYLPAFARLIPQLTAAYDALAGDDPLRAALAEPIAALKGWDYRWSAQSAATSLAVFWGDALWRDVGSFARAERVNVPDYIATRVSPAARLAALSSAVDRLTRDFGTWRTAWGDINRFQRLDDSIDAHFDDARASTPVPFTSAQWGSLASFGARAYDNTRKYYGTSGNSFVAVVEFGPKVKAWAVTAGGESGDPASPHFGDQIARYAAGALRPVYFYPQDISAHARRTYQPGN